MATTPHWALPYPLGADNPAIHTAFQNLANALDGVAMASRGTLAARPISTGGSPGISGRIYEATDNGRVYLDTGTGWIVLSGEDSGTALPANPINGQQFRLRTGSSPYMFIDLVYDSTYAKWVSAPMAELQVDVSTGSLFNVAAYTMLRITLLERFKEFFDAGLRPEFLLTGYGFGSTLRLSMGLAQYADGSDVGTDLLTPADANSIGPWVAGPTVHKTTGWIAPAITAPTSLNSQLTLQYKCATGATNTLLAARLRMRWVK